MKRPLVLRMEAVEACRARFHEKPYKPGVHDCPRLAIHLLRKLGVPVPFAKGLRWRSETDGLRALKALGFRNLIAAVDSLGLPRIAPAMAVTGDLVALPTTHKVGCLAVYMGQGAYLFFTDQTDRCEVLTNVTDFARDENGDPVAWRTIPHG